MISSFASSIKKFINPDTAENVLHLDAKSFNDQLTQAPPGSVLLDVRTEAESKQGMIPDSVLLDWNKREVFRKNIESFPKDLPVLVYCRSGMRSKSAAREIAAKGYNVINLKGGIQAWQRAGLPVKA